MSAKQIGELSVKLADALIARKIGELSVKLADAALIARKKGDDVHAIFFAIKAAKTLALAKALGWKPEDSLTEVLPIVQKSL